jgi:1-deoxy-D-xylulose-5-phosphate synthase
LALAKEQLQLTGKTIAVIGDGAMTGGMSFEALNYIGHRKSNVVVILNDNEMSISPNVGAMAMYLHKLRLEPAYTNPKDYLSKVLKNIPGFGTRLYNVLTRIEGSLKYLLTPGMLFEELGFKYIGPIDGYNFEVLERALVRARDRQGPVLVHVLTQKGRGYKPAQEHSNKFHGIGPFEIETGNTKKSVDSPPTYTEVFGNTLCKLASNNKNIIAITAAMKEGTGLTKFANEYPSRFYDVGIAEQHAVTMAAALAKSGLKPFVAIYSTFLQRAYDQIIHDVALTKQPVVFCLDRSGLVGEDGPTHHGCLDISYLRPIPNLSVLAPRDEVELSLMLEYASKQNVPIAIRYPRGYATGTNDSPSSRKPIITGKSEILKEGKDFVFMPLGSSYSDALRITDELESKHHLSVKLVNPRFVKPFDEELLSNIISSKLPIVTLEYNVLSGGFGSMLAEKLLDIGASNRLLRFGYPDIFIQHGSIKELKTMIGLDNQSIIDKILKWLNT